IVLHRERDAEQWQTLDIAAPGVELASLLAQRLIRYTRYPDLVVAGLGDALQHLVDRLSRLERAGAVGAAQGMKAEVEKRGHDVLVDKSRAEISRHLRGALGMLLASPLYRSCARPAWRGRVSSLDGRKTTWLKTSPISRAWS